MSETTGIIVILAGVLISGAGFYLLTQTNRQAIGFAVMFIGFTTAGAGLLTIEDTTVEERPPVTAPALTDVDATPAP